MSAQPRTVRAVIFDWGGTITPWHRIDHHAQWVGFASVLHRDGTEAAAQLAARILAAEDEAWQRGREEHVSARLADVLAAAGVDPAHADHDRALSAYQQFWEPHTHADPQVRPLWQALRDQGIKVGVLSNTLWTREYHRAVFDRDGLLELIDGDVYSSEIAWTKPHPEAFLAAARAVGVEPADCVYVGDRIFEDVHGAQRAGMRAILVPHSDIPLAQQVRLEQQVTPDAVAQVLAEIAGIVAGWSARPSAPA